MIIVFGIFNTIVNSEMCEFRSTDEDIYNDILFDTHWSDYYKDVSLIKSELITKMRKEKCFATPYSSNSVGHTYLYVFKNFGILYTRTNNPNWYRDESQSFIHNLPNHILFVLKYAGAIDIQKLLDIYKTNPEYFNQNYSTSYNICKIKEFVTIILYKFVFCLVFLVLLYI